MSKDATVIPVTAADLQYDNQGRLKIESPLERYQEYKVVADHELQQETREGWQLVAIIEETTSVIVHETEPSGGQDGTVVSVQRAHPQVFHRYVVGRDETSALADLAAKLALKAADHKSALDALAMSDAVRRERDELFSERDKLRAQLDDVRAERAEYHAQAQKTLRNYELDIGKIRAALGDIRMKEILGT